MLGLYMEVAWMAAWMHGWVGRSKARAPPPAPSIMLSFLPWSPLLVPTSFTAKN